MDIEKEYGIDNSMAKKLLRCAALFAVFSLIPVKTFLTNSDYERLLQPLPFTFTEQYTKKEILEKIPNAGDFYTH